MGAQSAKRAETWYMHVVPRVPHDFYHVAGAPAGLTEDIIKEEITAQAGIEPVTHRIGRGGVDPITRRAIWIVGFRKPVPKFRLFNDSSLSIPMDKPRGRRLHATGCQGYCNPFTCHRAARCSNCSELIAKHPDGQINQLCQKDAQCTNCRRPFLSAHSNCPAAPRVRNGKLAILTKKEREAVQKAGSRAYGTRRKAGQSGPRSERESAPEVGSAPQVRASLDVQIHTGFVEYSAFFENGF
ncbi:hypothetical protein EAF00_012030 [Botryotinia globosa]|nr:hypothetical protein EAF00_012030 [Botryotinia globosa]